jgi:methyltransferase
MTDNSFAYLVALIGITAIFRIYELFLAKTNLKARESDRVTHVKESYFFMFIVLHVSFLIFVPLEVYYLNRPFVVPIAIFSILVYLLCLFIRFQVLSTMGKSWNVKVVYDPISAEGIVKSGPYRYIRHPNYLVVMLEILILSLFHFAWISLIVFSIWNFILLYFRIRTEEEALMQNSHYRAFFEKKKRFIPGIF